MTRSPRADADMGAVSYDGDQTRVQSHTWLSSNGHGRIAKVEVSTDEGKTWKMAQLSSLALPNALQAAASSQKGRAP